MTFLPRCPGNMRRINLPSIVCAGDRLVEAGSVLGPLGAAAAARWREIIGEQRSRQW